MPWSIEWTDQAVRDLGRIDRSVARRIVAKLEQSSSNPRRFFFHLKGSDDHKLQVGDWRVIAVLSHATRTILVQHVDHRSRIYERG